MARLARQRVARCQRSAWLLVAIVAVAVTVSATCVDALERRKEIDFEALEKAWETDDAAQELKSEADYQYDRLKAASSAEAKAQGPQMVFVTLKTQEPLAELASRWKEMLWNGRVDANIYEIEAAKVLVGVQKGIYVRELRAFLNDQEEVVAYEWNSRTYSRDDPLVEAADALPVKTMQKKKTKKGKMTKAKAGKKKNAPTQPPQHDEV